MSNPITTFRISVHFLCGTFHGRSDGDQNEWPPSPLRLFAALVNVTARLNGGNVADSSAYDALRWLEAQPSPTIFAPRRALIQPHGYKTYVPDNVGDLVAKSWCRGNDNDIAHYRTEKRVRPVNLDEYASMHYLWPLAETEIEKAAALISVARSISQFGWGVDLVVADAAVETGDVISVHSNLEKWLPSPSLATGANSIRIPVAGTLDALCNRYDAFCKRISLAPDAVFRPVPPLTRFHTIGYSQEREITPPRYAVFALRKMDDSGFMSFDVARRGLHVAARCRHLVSSPDFMRAMGWSEAHKNEFVLGLDGDMPASGCRLDFIPLPSIEWQGDVKGGTVGAIRRILIKAPAEIDVQEFNRIIRFLEGGELVDEKTQQPVAFLRRERTESNAVSDYLKESAEWVTVTPIILPGYDDKGGDRAKLRDKNHVLTVEEKHVIVSRLDKRVEYLLRKALRQAGIPEVLAANAELEWRGSGFMQGVDLAANYVVPSHHRRFRRLHVRITWRDAEGEPLSLPGPLCFGGGRHTGIGLFMAVAQTSGFL
jgi:CRISPR-associated protein Csb2